MKNSRIPKLYKLNVHERVAELERLGWLSPEAARDLQNGRQVLSPVAADHLIENVFGVFGLPLAIAPNFIINGRECLVPMVVEEPSIVAGLSSAAALARETGGFAASCRESLLAGQIHITDVANVEVSVAALRGASESLIKLADAVHPRLSARGGGVRDIEIRTLTMPDGAALIVVHLLVDTCDAMGANIVNTICEAIAPKIVEICGGNDALRILSNLADRSIVVAEVRYPISKLATDELSGESIRDRIVHANDIACVDSYRAATHNKGVMNGIDALAIATGNDWRAIEAGAHAYAARDGIYKALTSWTVGEGGDLLGEIEVPLKTGIVGGTLESNPGVALALSIAGVESALQLSQMMAAVGLAQNFAALRALAGSGIQKGHMRLHARSLAAAAGAPDVRIDDVVDSLIASGEVKSWRAKEIVAEIDATDIEPDADSASAAGKVILFGEHAVVYGRHALALPIAGAVRANVRENHKRTSLRVVDWALDSAINRGSKTGIDAAINIILTSLGVADKNVDIVVRSRLPRGVGLGSSAAIAVAVTKAVAHCFGIDVADKRVNEIAFECEKVAHGTPSGIDNTISCYARAILYRNAASPSVEPLVLDEMPPLVIAFSHDIGLTHEQVAGVRARYERSTYEYDAVLDQIDKLSVRGAKVLQTQQYEELGSMMNICHGLLNALQVSTPDIERLVNLARTNGAVGAKLTGAGGGGAVVALCPDTVDQVMSGFRGAGYRTLEMTRTKRKQT